MFRPFAIRRRVARDPSIEVPRGGVLPRPPGAPDIQPHMLFQMKFALTKPNEENIVAGFGITIRKEHLGIYDKADCLEDANIDFYLELIKQRNNRPDSGYPTVFVFHSFFYKLLEKEGYKAVKGSTGDAKLWDYDLVLIPVHTNHHWVLVAVKFRENSMTCYDSVGRNNSRILGIIAKFVLNELSAHHGSDWGHVRWLFQDLGRGKIPQQKNGRDCGIFCLQFAEYLSRGMAFDFAQEHADYFRKRMMYETLKKTLLIE